MGGSNEKVSREGITWPIAECRGEKSSDVHPLAANERELESLATKNDSAAIVM